MRSRAAVIALTVLAGPLALSGCGDLAEGARADAGHLPVPDERPAGAEGPFQVRAVTGPDTLILVRDGAEVEVGLVGVGAVDVADPAKERDRPVPGSRADREEDEAEPTVSPVQACAESLGTSVLTELVEAGGGEVFVETPSAGADVVVVTGPDGVPEPSVAGPLVYVWVGDDLVNVELIREGVRAVEAGHPVPFSRQTAFRKVAREAKNAGAGLYEAGSCGQPVEEDEEDEGE